MRLQTGPTPKRNGHRRGKEGRYGQINVNDILQARSPHTMNEPTAPYSALEIRRAQNKRKAIDLGKAGLDPHAIAQQLRMPLFVARRILTVAGIPLRPRPAEPSVVPELSPAPIAMEPRRQGKLKPVPSDPTLPRRGPGRPRKVLLPDNPIVSQDPSHDAELERVRDRFSEFRTMAAISTALGISIAKVGKALAELPPERLEAWNDLNRMRREVDRLVVSRKGARR